MRPRLERLLHPIRRQKRLEARIMYLSIEVDVWRRRYDQMLRDTEQMREDTRRARQSKQDAWREARAEIDRIMDQDPYKWGSQINHALQLLDDFGPRTVEHVRHLVEENEALGDRIVAMKEEKYR